MITRLSKPFLFSIAGLVLLFTLAPGAQAGPITIIDQQNPGPAAGTSGGINFGQSFTPTLPGIDAIEILMAGDNDTVAVQILDGVAGFDGLGGPVIATSNPVVVNIPPGHQIIHFDFPGTVNLIPGQTYVARLFTPGGIDGVSLTLNNEYSRGQFLSEGFAIGFFPTTYDMIFTEGLHTPVPEPATLVLFSLGVAGLAIGRPRRHA